MFPTLLDGRKGVEEFNDLNYWKQPMASLSEDDEEDDDEEGSEQDEGAETGQEDSEGETAKVMGSSAGEAEKREMQEEADVIAPGQAEGAGHHRMSGPPRTGEA